MIWLRIRRLFHCALVFLAGVVCCQNLVRLVEISESYEASWWKVAFAVFLGVVFAIMATGSDPQTDSRLQGPIERASVRRASDETDKVMQRLKRTIEKAEFEKSRVVDVEADPDA